MNITKDLGPDAVPARFQSVEPPAIVGDTLTIISGPIAVQVQRLTEGNYSVFPGVMVKGSFIVGDSRKSTGRGGIVSIQDFQGRRHAIAACYDRSRRLVRDSFTT